MSTTDTVLRAPSCLRGRTSVSNPGNSCWCPSGNGDPLLAFGHVTLSPQQGRQNTTSYKEVSAGKNQVHLVKAEAGTFPGASS